MLLHTKQDANIDVVLFCYMLIIIKFFANPETNNYVCKILYKSSH